MNAKRLSLGKTSKLKEESGMSFLKRFLNSNKRLICLEVLFLTFALPALADNCSAKDRVPLPGCVSAEYLQDGAIITNYCDHPVTIKVDIANAGDKRIEVGANGGRTTVPVGGGRYKLNCCPKYNSCR